MKYSHRSPLLDAYQERYVRVIFRGKKCAEGILIWNETCKAPLFLHERTYYLKQNNGRYYRFAKYKVIDVLPVERGPYAKIRQI